MAERRVRIDLPREAGKRWAMPSYLSEEYFGVLSEKFARFLGTPYFIAGMTVFIIGWIVWNTFGPHGLRFDEYPFQFLNVMLSLQASYAAPLILLAQNRQADRDRVATEQDRSRDERNLADTEFLTREVASLRLALRENATRDFVRGELRDLLEEMEERGLEVTKARKAAKEKRRTGPKPPKSPPVGTSPEVSDQA